MKTFDRLLAGRLDHKAVVVLGQAVDAALASEDKPFAVFAQNDAGVEAPTGIIERTVRKGLEEKSQVQMIFTGR